LFKGEAKVAARAEWASGWKLVVASSAGASLTPLSVYMMGVFVAPLEQAFGWSRTLITSGLTIYAVVGVLFAAVGGALCDRLGPRRIAIPGVLLYCAGIAALSTATGSQLYWWAIWLLIAFSAVLVKPTIWSAAIISRFNTARGLALAAALSGVGLTGIFAPLVGSHLIDLFGWRWAFFGIGSLWFAVAMPLIFLFFYGAQDLDRTRRDRKTAVAPSAVSGVSIREAIRSAAFLKLAVSSFLVMLTVTASLVHFVPMVTHEGVDRSTAVRLASVIGLAAFIGRLITGSLLDRLSGTFVGGTVFALPAIALLAMYFSGGSVLIMALVAIIFGFCSGAELQVASYLASRFFGTKNFGTLFGLIMGLISFAAGMGPLLASFAFDRFGSYDVALLMGVPLSLLSGMLVFWLGRYGSPAPAGG
jgi:MFS family permease